jgi:succinylglutamate desuccinylase
MSNNINKITVAKLRKSLELITNETTLKTELTYHKVWCLMKIYDTANNNKLVASAGIHEVNEMANNNLVNSMKNFASRYLK